MKPRPKAILKAKRRVPMELPRKDEEGRSYISYSQLHKWKTSKRDYFRSYFFGIPFNGNAYTKFGNRVGTALENNDFSGFDAQEIKTLEKVTRLDEFETRVELDFGCFYVLMFFDTNSKDMSKIIDYKTGGLDKAKFYRSKEYDQIEIYACGAWLEVGRMPKQVGVELIERSGNYHKGEEFTIGKEIISIPRKITRERLEECLENVLKRTTEVNAYYKTFQKFEAVLI